jgi:lipoprotein NlpI
MALDGCRTNSGGRACKIYAIRRVVVWQDAAARAERTGPQLSAGERLIRDCRQGPTAAVRIERCSAAIASPELAPAQKRGPHYVRARAYEAIGDLRLAEQDYRAVLAIDPAHVEARARLERLLAPATAQPRAALPEATGRRL